MNKVVAGDENHDAEMSVCYKVFDILYIKGS